METIIESSSASSSSSPSPPSSPLSSTPLSSSTPSTSILGGEGDEEEEEEEEEEKAVSDKDNITKIISALFSYDTNRQKAILEQYYFPDATFLSPLMRTEGLNNIKQIFLIWKTLNKNPPTIENICFSEDLCIVFLKQNICPRLLPSFLLEFQFPVTIILKFEEEVDGTIKVKEHEEHWTIEGILSSVPLVSFWYNHVVRTMVGKFMTCTGQTIQTATVTANLLLARHRELDLAKKNIIKRIEQQCCDHKKEDYKVEEKEEVDDKEKEVLSFTVAGSNELDY